MMIKTAVASIVISIISGSVYSQHRCEDLHNLVTGIDHVPIVVADLTAANALFTKTLRFTTKSGRIHQGINNFFIKFEDGTYLEFVTPVDSTFAIGNYYSKLLKNGAGGTTIALATTSADSVILALQQCHISSQSDYNPVWKSVEVPAF